MPVTGYRAGKVLAWCHVGPLVAYVLGMTTPDDLAADPDVQRDRARRRELARLLWATRRLEREGRRNTAATLDALVDLRVTLQQATAWRRAPDLPEQ